LDISFSKASNISFLKGFDTLVGLRINGNDIEDLSPLAGLKNLFWGDITGNPVINDKDHCPVEGASNKYVRGYCEGYLRTDSDSDSDSVSDSVSVSGAGSEAGSGSELGSESGSN